MNPLQIAKAATTIVSSAGVGAIVGNAIKASTPENVTKIQKVAFTVGSIALSGVIAKHASNYAGEQLEEAAMQLKMLKDLKNND